MLQECGSCGTRYAAGLPACPHCWSTKRAGDAPAAGDGGQGDGDGDDEEADVAKISRSGGVTFDAEHDPGLAAAVPAEPEAVQDAAPEPEPAVEEAPEPVVTPEPDVPAEAVSAPPQSPPLPPKAGE